MAWQRATTARASDNREEELAGYREAIRDITTIAGDNACKIGKLQLQRALEAANCKGAYNLMSLAPTDADLDLNDGSIFQQSHIEAMQDLKRYNNAIGTKSIQGQRQQHRNSGQGNGNNYWQSFGSRFRGAGRGRGFQRGGGRGRGGFNSRSAPNFQKQQDQ